MTETWSATVSAQLAVKPLGTVLMFGSGASELLDSLRRNAAARVIRTEPDPQVARALQRKHAQDPSVTIRPLALTGLSGTVTLRHFNLSQATSFRAPTGLKTLFPGLREIGQIELQAQGAAAAIEEAELEGEGEHVLILGAAGEEMPMIAQLSDLDLMQRFNHVIVPLPTLPLYEGAAAGKAIRARLEGAGFRIVSLDLSDPDIPLSHWQLDRAHLALVAERDALRAVQEKAQAEIAQLRTAREELAKAREAQKELEQVRVFTDTYRHALRLELMRSHRANAGRNRVASPALLRWLEALDGPTSVITSHHLAPPTFNLDVYRKTTSEAAEQSDRHIVLDVKSLPRSGLHYMKRQFERLFQDRFSFCEWYQEPGCCKRMPCAFVPREADEAGGGALRMLKSHDFDLADPIYPATPGIQRLILIRDPLYVLTSHWVLHLLARNKDLLSANDIKMEKIFYLHEPTVLSQAYAFLNAESVIPNEEEVTAFLSKQQDYMNGFARKWAMARRMPRTFVVPYHKVPDAIVACLEPIRDRMSSAQRARLDEYATNRRTGFHPRQDPFKGPTPFLTSLLERHAKLFRSAADAIHDADTEAFFKPVR